MFFNYHLYLKPYCHLTYLRISTLPFITCTLSLLSKVDCGHAMPRRVKANDLSTGKRSMTVILDVKKFVEKAIDAFSFRLVNFLISVFRRAVKIALSHYLLLMAMPTKF